uniref:RGS domain-containing protein n=1 Tax=Seriola lalandi dorsalis TaxID=1841481 RepID=A0A3B4XFJ5_SERLL
MVVYQFSLVFPRLAKLLFQWEPHLCIQRRKRSSSRTTNFTYQPSGQREHINAECMESSRCFSSCSEPDNPCTFSSFPSSYSSCSSNLPSAGNSERQHLQKSSGQDFESSQLQLEYLAARVVKQVLNNALKVMDHQRQQNISGCFSKSVDQTHCTSTDKPCECKVCQHSPNGGRERLEGKKEKVQERKRGSRDTDHENVPDICCHGSCCQGNIPGLGAFKEFLRGTPGEKLINLWMDIEKLKATQHRELKFSFYINHFGDCITSFLSLSVLHQLCSGRSQFLEGRRMEKMLQALSVDSRAGLYFTHFCVQSGNQWITSLVQREAQLLYSTYLYTSARRSIGVDEEIRRKVYNRLMPAFEELFDEVEEHTLNILLQPWTLLVSRDEESFQKVTTNDKLLQLSLKYFVSFLLINQLIIAALSGLMSVSPNSWSSASPNYQGYRLGSLLRHRHEIGHFMSFLQNQDASVHLTCWLDLEQYRRTPQRDKAVKQERSSHIATKYLNRKYFFGPDSPASTEQQNDIMHLAGGLERLKLECLSNVVVVEIQDIVRHHIEKTWLPQFLSTAEFTERQKHKPKVDAEMCWRAEGLWMSSSKEILLFRQILLNPVTCLQFQHFVSLKGDFLENDMLFWLEVQRYKDLCHSHSDEATIQQKISTIINCFINSSMPPSLQIDIPPEQAQHILEKRHKLGPYIFREAQMSVFSELLKVWPEFQELSSSVEEKQLLPLLDEDKLDYSMKASSVPTTDYEDLTRFLDIFPQLSWSYSKYMAALKREEVLLRKKSQLEASFSTASGTHTPPFLSQGSVKLPYPALLTFRVVVTVNSGNHNTEMIFSRSHGKIQAKFPRL